MGHKNQKSKKKRGGKKRDTFYEDLVIISNAGQTDATQLIEIYDSMSTKYPPYACFGCGKELPEKIVQEIQGYYRNGYVEPEGVGKIPISQIGFMFFCSFCLKQYQPGKIVSAIKSGWGFITKIVGFILLVAFVIILFPIRLVLQIFRKEN